MDTAIISEQVQTSLQKPVQGTPSRIMTAPENTPDEGNEQPVAVKRNVEDVDFAAVVSKVGEFVDSLGTRVGFKYDARSSQPVIRVYDRETGDLIRQIPDEEMLNLLSKLKDITGLIFHESA